MHMYVWQFYLHDAWPRAHNHRAVVIRVKLAAETDCGVSYILGLNMLLENRICQGGSKKG